jgi:hypothetical protein
MQACKDCGDNTSIPGKTGACQITGLTFPDRTNGRCPEQWFWVRVEEAKKSTGIKTKAGNRRSTGIRVHQTAGRGTI